MYVFSVLRIWPNFGSVFRFSHLKTAAFWFRCLGWFVGFLQFSLWFSVFVKNDSGFWDFSVQCFQNGLSGFAKEVTTCSRAKTVIPRDNLHSVLPLFLEEWMTRLISLADVIWVVSTISQTSRGWDNILRTLTLDWTIAGITFRSLAPFTFIWL